MTERFTKAIEQLGVRNENGKPKLEIRLGGIYALEPIARDSERDHWPIMELLTACVREKAHNFPHPLTVDIQAILTVICHRKWRSEKSDQTLDLHGAYLHGADLSGAHLNSAMLSAAQLKGATRRAHAPNGRELT